MPMTFPKRAALHPTASSLPYAFPVSNHPCACHHCVCLSDRLVQVYGCLLAKLQTTVRSFYDIEGADVSDWCLGCLCPCVTLVRNEKEILLRESQHQRLKNVLDRDSSVLEPYRPPAPMENPIDQYRPTVPIEKPVDKYRPSGPMENPVPLPNIPRSTIMSPDDIESSLDTRILPSIAEVSREASTASGSASHSGHRG